MNQGQDSAPVIGAQILRFDCVTSTNDIARGMVSDAGEGTVIVAAEQTVGRGTQGRRWFSPSGVNLLFSTIVRPGFSVERAPELSIVASLGVARYLIADCGLVARIKWPNDVRVNSRKIAGILIETVTGADGVLSAIVGVGLNVNWTDLPDEIAGSATSLLLETGRPTDFEEALRGVLAALDSTYRRYCAEGYDETLRQWKALECVTNKPEERLS